MHREFTILMSLVLDGEASAEESDRLHRHLSGCGACSGVWQQWQGLSQRLERAPSVAPPPSLVVSVAALLQAKRRQHLRRRWFASGLLLAWGGTICGLWMLMLLTFWWGYNHPAQLGVLLSSGAQALAALAALFQGLSSPFSELGREPAFGLAFAGLAGLAGAMVAGWVWLVARTGVDRRLSEGLTVEAEHGV